MDVDLPEDCIFPDPMEDSDNESNYEFTLFFLFFIWDYGEGALF